MKIRYKMIVAIFDWTKLKFAGESICAQLYKERENSMNYGNFSICFYVFIPFYIYFQMETH